MMWEKLHQHYHFCSLLDEK
uniref:Uncharacterized protein n=1 Tax=Rhizophora mucronata TaxID=61149 RepID=A0A2P2Q9Q3_RHIMU